MLRSSSFSCRANCCEGILAYFEYCKEFLIILILGINRWRLLDLLFELFVVQVLVVDVHQILHVILIEEPLCNTALPHVGRLLDVVDVVVLKMLVDVLSALLGIEGTQLNQSITLVPLLFVRTVPSMLFATERRLKALIQIFRLLV